MRLHFNSRSSGNQIPSENLSDLVNAVVQMSQEFTELKKRIADLEEKVKSLETIPEPGNVRME